LTMFDNGGAPPRAHKNSRGIRVAINTRTHTTRLVAEYRHAPELASNFEGNLQPLPHGDVFLGWGQQPFFSEDTASGSQDFSADFPSGTSSYRAYRFDWNAEPATPPALALSRGPGGLLTAYASWNGATDVASWRILAGPSPSALIPLAGRVRTGFETMLTLHTRQPYVALQALGLSGKVLATSPVKKLG
jgi:hypothetical protein